MYMFFLLFGFIPYYIFDFKWLVPFFKKYYIMICGFRYLSHKLFTISSFTFDHNPYNMIFFCTFVKFLTYE